MILVCEPHPDDYAGMIACGCEDWSDRLGIQKMPEGYALMLDADGMFFFWCELATGRCSVSHWNKWAVYRGAKNDLAKRSGL